MTFHPTLTSRLILHTWTTSASMVSPDVTGLFHLFVRSHTCSFSQVISTSHRSRQSLQVIQNHQPMTVEFLQVTWHEPWVSKVPCVSVNLFVKWHEPFQSFSVFSIRFICSGNMYMNSQLWIYYELQCDFHTACISALYRMTNGPFLKWSHELNENAMKA